MANSLEQQVRALVRDVPDFPKPGILFRDLTPVMRDPQAWKQVMEVCSSHWLSCSPR